MKKVVCSFLIFLVSLFLVSCNKEYKDYMDNFKGYKETVGTKINTETVEQQAKFYNDESFNNLKVIPIENLKEDFIFGVDISSVIELLDNGAVYYDEKGRERDLFEILKESGVNYVRIRHWNDPTNDEGKLFGGGSNNLETNIKIAKMAARVGMRIVLNFHYSDFWADPGKQTIPRMWQSLSELELVDEIYNYTYEIIKEFEKANVRPHMVQIGNEINTGLLHPIASIDRGYKRVAMYLESGIKAVKDISEDILTIIHLAEGASEQQLVTFYDRMISNGLDFDIIGLSYYSFWHGDLERFKETLNVLNERYEQKIAVMEYSYGYTTKETEYANHIFNEELAAMGGYGASLQGQVSYIRDVNDAVNSISNGIGSFYWEPAWLPIKNAGWANNNAKSYLENQGDSLSGGLVSWANQALFSFTGKVTPAINVFNMIKGDNSNIKEEVLSYEEKIDLLLNIRNKNEQLPKYVKGYTNLDRTKLVKVVWNKEDLEKLNSGEGDYLIRGHLLNNENLVVEAHVTAYENYIIDGSFEELGRLTSDLTNFEDVLNWDIKQSTNGVVKIESKNPYKEGFNNINIYYSVDYEFDLFQEVELEKGKYELIVYGRSALENDSLMPNVSLYANDFKTEITYGSSWSEWVMNKLVFEVNEEKRVIVGIKGSGLGGSWAHFDNFILKKIKE